MSFPYTFPIVFRVDRPTPKSRTLTIPAETRTHSAAAESRIHTVPYENRTVEAQ